MDDIAKVRMVKMVCKLRPINWARSLITRVIGQKINNDKPRVVRREAQQRRT